ncbi:MAG: cupin domain-containing protein [Parvularculaceae bacterium]|nr:cupin domain-containing protein [Caulobacterales bacterium]HRX41123.1 cupin domain-containing protein [Parvularculaceae bacterium]
MEVEAIIEALGLSPHPEGGWYRETWRADARAGERAAGTAIYFLLKKGERSHWHYIDAAEIWHFYAGAPLRLSLSADGKKTSEHILGPDIASGARPQIVVPQGCWQAGESLGDYTLIGCTVSPAFEFAGFEMAPKDWAPGER